MDPMRWHFGIKLTRNDCSYLDQKDTVINPFLILELFSRVNFHCLSIQNTRYNCRFMCFYCLASMHYANFTKGIGKF